MDINFNEQMIENSEGKPKKKIVINIQRSHGKAKNSQPSIPLPKQEEKARRKSQIHDELPKLFEIAERCKEYFMKFLQEKQEEINYTEFMFSELKKFLDDTFTNLYSIIEAKKRQIQGNIVEKREQFFSIKEEQLNKLNGLIMKIDQSTLNDSQLKEEFDIKTQQKITYFASLLNEFYENIEEIEKVNYRQNIRQSIDFLHHVIEDESAAFSQDKIFQPSIPNVSISFNNDQLFSVKDDPQQNWEDFRALTEKRQNLIENKLNFYKTQIKV